MATPTRRLSTFLSLSVLLLGLSACGDGPVGPGESLTLTIVSGDHQVAATNTRLASPLIVRLTGDGGRPIQGVRISWVAEEPEGFVSLSASPSLTDFRGWARVNRTLGSGAGVHGTRAFVDGPAGPSVRFVSVAQVHGAVEIAMAPDDSGDGQRDTVLSTLSPYRVLVVDQDKRPIAGVPVRWFSAGGGVLSESQAVTGADGIAQVTATLGAEAVVHTAAAYVVGLIGSPVEFRATADPGRPVEVLTNTRVHDLGVVGQPVDGFVIRVADAHGNFVPGMVVDWAVTAGAGSVTPEHDVTQGPDGPDGPSSIAVHTLGPAEGVQAVTATLPGLAGTQVLFETRAVSAVVGVVAGWDYYYYYDPYLAFIPADVEVPAGGTVGWFWVCYIDECPARDVTFEDAPGAPASSPSQVTGYHFRTFTEAGIYRYRSMPQSTSFSSGMVGMIRVR